MTEQREKVIERKYLNELITRYPILRSCTSSIGDAFHLLRDMYERKGKLLIAGNGGSAADADHIVGELMKGFQKERKLSGVMRERMIHTDWEIGTILADRLQNALPAIALHNHGSLNTAVANDKDGDLIFAQQIMGYGRPGDIFLGISTSGNSRNILYAAVTARARKMPVIALTGHGGGELASFSDIVIAVDEEETYKVQELHLPVYHSLCMMLEEYFFVDFKEI